MMRQVGKMHEMESDEAHANDVDVGGRSAGAHCVHEET